MATQNLHFLFIFIPFILILLTSSIILFCVLLKNKGDPLKVSGVINLILQIILIIVLVVEVINAFILHYKVTLPFCDLFYCEDCGEYCSFFKFMSIFCLVLIGNFIHQNFFLRWMVCINSNQLIVGAIVLLFAESVYFLDIYRRFALLLDDKVANTPSMAVLGTLLFLNLVSMYIWMKTLVLTSFQMVLWGLCWNRVYPKQIVKGRRPEKKIVSVFDYVKKKAYLFDKHEKKGKKKN